MDLTRRLFLAVAVSALATRRKPRKPTPPPEPATFPITLA